MASLREKLTSSPHVRFQSPVPGVVEAEQAKEKEREREMGVQRRDGEFSFLFFLRGEGEEQSERASADFRYHPRRTDAVAAMNKSFGMLL